jgi:hypothetical protein
LIDLPPGTGDVSMTLAQLLPQAQFVIVTTPQQTAQKVARRAAQMAHKVSLEIGGVIENMSGFTTPSGERFAIFGEGGGKELADELDVPLLGSVPLTMPLREHADSGVPLVIEDPDDPASQAIHQVARGLIAMAAARSARAAARRSPRRPRPRRPRRARGLRAKTGGHVAADGLVPPSTALALTEALLDRLTSASPLERIVCLCPYQEKSRNPRTNHEEFDERRAKMERLRAEGIDPYPPVTLWADAHAHRRRARRARPRQLEPGEHPELRYQIAGRLISRRGHGKTAFLDMRDLSGSIQAVVRVDALGEETYDRILGLDIGDIVGIEGCVYVTQRGQLALAVIECTLLTKTLRPPPDKHHGLGDTGTRYRYRELDLLANEETRELFITRHRSSSRSASG